MGPGRKIAREFAGGGASDEALWLAFRYVHDELSADEAEAFEERLATEQPVREALAEATRLSDFVHAALDRELAASPSSTLGRRDKTAPGRSGRFHIWQRSISWAAMGTAACLALFLAWNAIWSGGNNGVAVNGDPSSGELETSPELSLAQAFSSVRDAWPVRVEEPCEIEAAEEELGEEETSPAASFADDWIMVAVVAAQSSQGQENH
jgi:anti-sigma factor RsiW